MKPHKYRILDDRLLADGWGTLRALTYEKEARDGSMREAKAELYNTGNSAAVLPYDPVRGTVVLIRQLRIATVYNGHPEGVIIEAVAGKIDEGRTPEQTVLKEAEEETGYRLGAVREVMSPYVSPGAFTERIHLFVGEYNEGSRHGEGGGREEEGEYIEVLELPFADALQLLESGQIMDAKTVMLLQWAALHHLLPSDGLL